MITLNGQRILIGGFHDHWTRADADNPTLLLASLNYYHYDFSVLMDGADCAKWQQAAAAFSKRLVIYPGREEAYGWGHVVTVAPRAEAPRADDPDFSGVLSRLRETCEMVFLAHPAYVVTWQKIFQPGHLDRLIDDGCVDGIELTVERFFSTHERNAELVAWYQARERAGRPTPIVGGWDMHMMNALPRPAPVLYSAAQSPDGHYETPCSNRTLVFAEENSLPAIKDAVLGCRSVIEEMPSGRLVGPPALVEFLERQGYRQAIQEMDRRRDAVTLGTRAPLIMGQAGRLRISQPGQVRLPTSLAAAAPPVTTGNDVEIEIPSVPALLDRDSMYLPLSWCGTDGTERIWGVPATHPISLEVLPWLDADGPAAEVLPLLPFAGSIHLKIPALGMEIEKPIHARTLIPLPGVKASQPILHYELTATGAGGLSRRYAGFLCFVGVSRFRGDWSKVPKVGVDRPEFVPTLAYGLGRPWPGADVFSAQLQFAWDETAFRMRIAVRDAVHFQPFTGHYAYNADCLQLGLDPMLRRQETLGTAYTYNLALTPQGPELYRGWAPDGKADDGTPLPRPETSLGDRHLQVAKTDQGLLYEMTLPWQELAPVTPRAGHRLGIYYIMFNNDGGGLIDTLHWPVPIHGMWLNPSKWGTLTLLDAP
jgi:hypothetical protein